MIKPIAITLVTSAALGLALPARAETSSAPPAPPPSSAAPVPPPPAAIPAAPGEPPPPAYPPPNGYALPPGYAPPPGAYYPPPQAGPVADPNAPVMVRTRRSPQAMYAGAGLVAIGGLGLIVGVTITLTSGLRAWENAYGCNSNCSTSQSVGLGLMIGGLITAAVGVPLLVYGAKRVPAQFSWVGEPTATGWQWRF
ncbi:MAG: hypothetical protein QM820_50255 [Minicystis sp.]